MIGLLFIMFPLKLYLLLASMPFMAFALSDHKLALKSTRLFLGIDLFKPTVTLK